MRFYVWTEGDPGYITAEVAIRDVSGPDEARAWASDWWTPLPGQRIISEAEARMRPACRDALERWERRDDAILQAREVATIRAEHRDEAMSHAALGCSVAAAALADDDAEAIRAAINEHVHEGCGGRYFPDEPTPRRLNVVR